MLNEAEFQTLKDNFPALGSIPPKVQELIRDELEPGEVLEYAESVKVQGAGGVVCMSDKNVYGFWLMKMFFVMKFPAIQTFHLAQITQLKGQGAQVYLRADADPKQPDEDYEENQFTFANESAAARFVSLVKEKIPNPAPAN